LKPAEKSPNSGQKNAGKAGVFFALLPPFWYGPSLESWGRFSATGICSKTQEEWGFPGFSRPSLPEDGLLSAMGRFGRKRKSDR
jgi:hypothetical protein